MKNKTIPPILLLISSCIFGTIALTGLIFIIIGSSELDTIFIIGLYMIAIGCIVFIPCLADFVRLSKERKNESKIGNCNSSKTTPPSETNSNEIEKVIKDIVLETIEQNTANSSTAKKPIKYCIDCGCAIDKNSNYCKICGKEQE